LGVIGGIVLGGILIAIISTYSNRIYGSNHQISQHDPASMKAFIESLPIAAFVWLIIANSLGAFAAGMFASRLSESNHFYLGIVAAGVLFLLGLVNFFTLPGIPTWYMLNQSFCVLLLSYLGARIGSRSHSLNV